MVIAVVMFIVYQVALIYKILAGASAGASF